MSKKEIKIGDIVRYIGKEHDTDPEVNPPVGTLGKVLRETRTPDSVLYFIQWEKGSTSDDDCWYQSPEEVELVEDIKIGKPGKGHIDFDVSNKEIWEMLKPKMEKNGLKPIESAVVFCGDSPLFKTIPKYSQDYVHNAIALAYRSGYLRAMKGRPFMIGKKKEKEIKEEKKQGGRWVPVDPNNLPKEGTKVRYKGGLKGCNWKKNSEAKWIKTENNRFSIKFDEMNWTLDCMNRLLKYFDMWVEDEE